MMDKESGTYLRFNNPNIRNLRNSGNSPKIRTTYKKCNNGAMMQSMHYLCITCASHVHHLCITCASLVHHLCIINAQMMHNMCITYALKPLLNI